MSDKPKHADGYDPAQVVLARKTCLYVATVLGDEMMNEIVIAGGLVPSLLIDQSSLSEPSMAHVGTMDVDVGFQLALLDDERYKTLSEALRSKSFAPVEKAGGTKRLQTWTSKEVPSAHIDFLMPPGPEHDGSTRVQHLEEDFAAFIIDGLHIAFRNPRRVRIADHDIEGRWANREVQVCGPGAFVVLKALAHVGRDEEKDAYDLYYLLQHYGNGIEDIADDLRPLLDDRAALQAMANLRAEYTRIDAVGPDRLAKFLYGRVHDDDIRADLVGLVEALLRSLGQL